jgi:hypothetical protein
MLNGARIAQYRRQLESYERRVSGHVAMHSLRRPAAERGRAMKTEKHLQRGRVVLLGWIQSGGLS